MKLLLECLNNDIIGIYGGIMNKEKNVLDMLYEMKNETINKIVDYKNKINNLEGTLKEIDAAIERNKSKIRKREK